MARYWMQVGSLLVCLRVFSVCLQRKASGSVERLFLNVKTFCPRLLADQSLYLKGYFGSWLRAKFLPKSRSPNYRKNGLHDQLSLSSWRKYSIDVLRHSIL